MSCYCGHMPLYYTSKENKNKIKKNSKRNIIYSIIIKQELFVKFSCNSLSYIRVQTLSIDIFYSRSLSSKLYK